MTKKKTTEEAQRWHMEGQEFQANGDLWLWLVRDGKGRSIKKILAIPLCEEEIDFLMECLQEQQAKLVAERGEEEED